jgi:hypothetical protein
VCEEVKPVYDWPYRQILDWGTMQHGVAKVFAKVFDPCMAALGKM